MNNDILIISHRGLLDGPNSILENRPSSIHDAIDKGFEVEIDLWMLEGRLWLGHNHPQYLFKEEQYDKTKIWCHAKNHEAFQYLILQDYHCFWHNHDSYAITSKKYIWTHKKGKALSPRNKLPTIYALPENDHIVKENLSDYYGVCTDFPFKYKN